MSYHVDLEGKKNFATFDVRQDAENNTIVATADSINGGNENSTVEIKRCAITLG